MPDKINTDIIRLNDILNAIKDIESFKEKSSFDDRMSLMAAAYGIAIIGEAANKLSGDFRDKYSYIPWSNIIGMRHRIIHSYGNISTERLKEVINNHLPTLKEQVTDILEKIKLH